MLVRVLLEAIGAMARSVGPRFAVAGGLLRAVLLPTLERLGEGRHSDANRSQTGLSWDLPASLLARQNCRTHRDWTGKVLHKVRAEGDEL